MKLFRSYLRADGSLSDADRAQPAGRAQASLYRTIFAEGALSNGVKRILPLIVAAAIAVILFAPPANAQRRKTPRFKTQVPKLQPKKPEVEDWKEFDIKEAKVRLLFPKPPSVTVTDYRADGQTDSEIVRSTVAQAEINSEFYFVEIREHAANVLPDREDLAISYGLWLRNYILRRSTVISEKNVAFGQFAVVEFVYQDVPTEIVVHRVMVAGRNLYQLIVHIDKSATDSDEAVLAANQVKINRFFLSFDPYDGVVVDKSIGG